VDSQPLGLLNLQWHFAVVIGQEDKLWRGFLDFGQLRSEILIVGRVGFKGDDPAAVFFKNFLEYFGDAFVVLRGYVI